MKLSRNITLSVISILSLMAGLNQALKNPVLEPLGPAEIVKVVEAKNPISPVRTVTLDGDDKSCLALNIYHEGRDQGRVGMLLVGHVTLNRVESKRYPGNACEVVYQRKQFSWTWTLKDFVPKDKSSWNESLELADLLLKREFDRSQGALYYYNPKLANPSWAKSPQMKVVKVHKDHTFLRRL